MVLRRCTIFLLDLTVKAAFIIFWQNIFSVLFLQFCHR